MKVLRGAYDPLATVGGVIEVARVVRGIADNLGAPYTPRLFRRLC